MQGQPGAGPYRRLAAVWFADIVGFTELSGRDEPASLQLVERFESAVRAAAAAYGGTIVKFLGDGALVHFSSTEAAVSAALDARARFQQEDDARLRAGVHVGDILVRADGDVYGDGVNVASRLQSVAGPGEVVVSEEAWRQLRHLGSFDFNPLGSRRLKGVPERRAVYAVERAGDAAAPAPRRRPRAPPRAMAALTAVVAAVFAAWWVLTPGDRVVTAELAPVESLVVLPFDNLSGNPEEAYFVAGMHDALIGELTEFGSLRVISRTSSIRYADTTRSLAEIARELDVDAVVAASVLRSGINVRIRAELIRVFPSEQSLWAGTFDREMQDVLVLHSELARALADAIRLRLTPGESARLARAASVDPDAYEAYLRGRFHWDLHTDDDLDRAYMFFRRALEHDPDFAPAYAGIAFVWAGRRQNGTVPPETASREAKAAAARALELDTGHAHAHQAMGIELGWYDWDWEAAEQHLAHAVALNPGDPWIRAFYALVLRVRGDFDVALEQARLAESQDPFNPMIRQVTASNLLGSRRIDEAIAHYEKVLADWPEYRIALRGHMLALHVAGRHEEALAATRALFELDGETALLEQLDARTPDERYETTMHRLAVSLAQRSEHVYVPASHVMQYYLRAGDVDHAFEWLEKAVTERDPNAAYLNWALYDPLRTDPRFEAFLRRMNLAGT